MDIAAAVRLWGKLSSRGRALTVLGGATSVVLLIGVAAAVFSGSDSDSAVAGEQVQVPVDGAELLDAIDATPEDVVGGVLAGLLGTELSPAETETLVSSLVDILGTGTAPTAVGASGETEEATIVNAFVRRLDLDPSKEYSLAELIDLVVADIDPDGLIDSPSDLLDAITTWARNNPANALRLVSPDTASGLLANLDSLTFDDAVTVLAQIELSAETFDIPFAGIEGLDDIQFHRVTWDIDETTNSVTFIGDASSLVGGSSTTEGLVSVLWAADGGADDAEFVAGIHLTDWSLDMVGVTGALGEHQLGDLTFVLSTSESRLVGNTLPPLVQSFIATNYAAELRGLAVDGGINVLANLPLTALPEAAVQQLGLDDDDRAVALSGFIGANFSVARGVSAFGTNLALRASLPPFDPPSLPSWIGLSPDDRWDLSIDKDGSDIQIALSGVVEARVDGTHRFSVSMDIDADADSTSAVLKGTLQEPWTSPFDIEWLTLEQATLEINLSEEAATAKFAAVADIAGHEARLTFDVANSDSDISAELTATFDQITAAEAVDFISAKLGATKPPIVPSFMLRDIELKVQTGSTKSISLTAIASLAGREAPIVLAAINDPNSGRPTVIVGAKIPSWNLGDVVDSLKGTPLAQLQFPDSTLIASSLKATIAQANLPGQVSDFFGNSGSSSGESSFSLQPGLSLLSNISLKGTPFESPLAAFGGADPSLPVIGTLPTNAFGFGGGGSSGGGGLLDNLSLTIQFPEINPSGGPDWLEAGQLSLRVQGRSVGLAGKLTVEIDDEMLTFTVSADVKFERGVSFVLSGILETERPWVAPFDQQWLTVNRAAIELEVAATGKVGIGVAGSVVIGEKSLDAAMKIELCGPSCGPGAAVPVNFSARFSSKETEASEAALSTTDLIMLQQRLQGGNTIDASEYPSIALRNIDFSFALKDSDALEIKAGFKLKGDAYMAVAGGPGELLAALDIDITRGGILASGSLPNFTLGPLEFGATELRLVLSLAEQSFAFDSNLALFGIGTGVEIDLNSESIFFNGSDALEWIESLITVFQAAVNDPVGSLNQLPTLLQSAGVPEPTWLQPLLNAISTLPPGVGVSEGTINTILGGGSLGGDTGGFAPTCPGIRYEHNGRCYDPPRPRLGFGEHTPSGGYPLECRNGFDLEGQWCWVIPPSEREIAGLCKQYPVPCNVQELFSGKVAGLLADKVADLWA
jgi:hypothetical protein